MNWLSEMTQHTSTPHPKTQNSSRKTQKSQKLTQKSQNSQKKNAVVPLVLDDFDTIESLFDLLDNDDEDMSIVPKATGRSKMYDKCDSEIDSTMAYNVCDITMKEPISCFTTGFNTMMVSY